MHPSQMSGFRKTIIACLTIAFAGALLVFTAMANLKLLISVYPDPQFYVFGLLALEGGVIYWTGYYLLNLSGTHKGIAVISLAVDALLSGVGFFYEMEQMTHSTGIVPLPPVIIVVGFAVVFNVAMSLISHLISTGYTAQPKAEPVATYPNDYLAQTTKGPGFFTNVAASALAATQTVGELAKEKRQARKGQQSIDTPVIEEKSPN